jgi:hypothetical protein
MEAKRMNRTKPEQRANRRRKIAQRKNLINSINRSWSDPNVSFCEYANIKDGYLDNNNEMNKYGQRGSAKKTKTKHGHASYRHSGAHGQAINRIAHDQRQVDSMDQQETEEL